MQNTCKTRLWPAWDWNTNSVVGDGCSGLVLKVSLSSFEECLSQFSPIYYYTGIPTLVKLYHMQHLMWFPPLGNEHGLYSSLLRLYHPWAFWCPLSALHIQELPQTVAHPCTGMLAFRSLCFVVTISLGMWYAVMCNSLRWSLSGNLQAGRSYFMLFSDHMG